MKEYLFKAKRLKDLSKEIRKKKKEKETLFQKIKKAFLS